MRSGNFNPLFPYGERLRYLSFHKKYVSIHSPYTGRDSGSQGRRSRRYFNPLSLYRERPRAGGKPVSQEYFNPLFLHGERPQGASAPGPRPLNFNPLSPCGERHFCSFPRSWGLCYFNPLSPCGRDEIINRGNSADVKFQSTLPVKGETKSPNLGRYDTPISIHSPMRGETRREITKAGIAFQSTLPVRGETQTNGGLSQVYQISIHSPHAGRDIPVAILVLRKNRFQSTLPMRGRDRDTLLAYLDTQISIHSPRAGRDWAAYNSLPLSLISIHSPCAGRDFCSFHIFSPFPISIHSPRTGRDGAPLVMDFMMSEFQSTLPAWGETSCWRRRNQGQSHFNPLSPHGERQPPKRTRSEIKNFNPLSLYKERRPPLSPAAWGKGDFNPLSPCGERLAKACIKPKYDCISIHSPLAGRDSTFAQRIASRLMQNRQYMSAERLVPGFHVPYILLILPFPGQYGVRTLRAFYDSLWSAPGAIPVRTAL